MDLAAPPEHANTLRDTPDPKTLSPSVPAQLHPPKGPGGEGISQCRAERSGRGAAPGRAACSRQAAELLLRLLRSRGGSPFAGQRWAHAPQKHPLPCSSWTPVGLGGCVRPPAQPPSPPAVETLTAPKHRGETTAVVLPPPRYPNGKPKTRHNVSSAEPLPRAPDRNILDFTKV